MKVKNILNVVLSGLFILVFSLICFFVETPDYSDSERRVLEKMPEITLDKIVSGEFSKKFESYTTDRFPLRDFWRSIKAYVRYNVFMQSENNGIFVKDGHISKLDYEKNDVMLQYAKDLFLKVNDSYLTENKVYFAMIPDKNMFLADLKLDYKAIEEYFKNELPFENISVMDLLEKDDYYFTDSHWHQNKIIDVKDRILKSMGVELNTSYTENVLDIDFYGVYAGQSALKVKPDKITYLTNDAINSFKVTGAKAVYDMEKAESKDAYEFFLSGNQPVITIENPKNTSGKRLIIFRDSFGSSISPLLAEGYSETVLVDLRYINSSLLDKFVNFENADVLFLYSTVLLNSSKGMK